VSAGSAARGTASPRTILIAPDSFKGSLTSVKVARALGEGWRRARPDDTILLSPLADGGEGTLAAIEAAGGWTWRRSAVHDPLGRPIDARWLWREVGGAGSAFVEMATASGLSLIRADERDPIAATSIGTGELIAAAIDQGVARITLGIGGSATTDGGRGLLDGLLTHGATDRRLDDVELEVACDVSNPLLGPTGAAAIFGPQKGASPAQVLELDERNARWADDLDARQGRDERETPGAGAAGGVGYALLSIQARFRSFALRPGVELVMELTDFDAKLAQADLVITGEGRIDAQTAFGKTALGVAQRAAAASVACIAVGGGVEPEGIEALAALDVAVVPVVERPQTVEEAMAAGTAPLERCAERIAQLIWLVD
jgi:glycerate kinase